MNYLAHTLLTGKRHDWLIGNLCGDFIKGRELDHLDPGIKAGLILHRKIDALTDAQPEYRRCRTLIAPSRRKYAGVITDIAFDHFLCRHWAAFCDRDLDEYVDDMYALCRERLDLFPNQLGQHFAILIERDWLRSCRTMKSLSQTFSRVGLRLRRVEMKAGFVRADIDIKKNYLAFDEIFLTFFPLLYLLIEQYTQELELELEMEME